MLLAAQAKDLCQREQRSRTVVQGVGVLEQLAGLAPPALALGEVAEAGIDLGLRSAPRRLRVDVLAAGPLPRQSRPLGGLLVASLSVERVGELRGTARKQRRLVQAQTRLTRSPERPLGLVVAAGEHLDGAFDQIARVSRGERLLCGEHFFSGAPRADGAEAVRRLAVSRRE